MEEVFAISDQEYQKISKLVYDRFGINLGEKKRALVSGRLYKLLRQNRFTSFAQYYDYLLKDQSGEALSTFIDRISTNHTYFNREPVHFEFFVKKLLPEVCSVPQYQQEKEIRIWSAGCSSGEEPYNLAMLVDDYFSRQPVKWNYKILATDISLNVLSKAEAGLYSDENVSHLPETLRRKYLLKQPNGMWQVKPEIKNKVLFRRLNLMRSAFPFKRLFHTIFCRNVMIYFDEPTRKNLVAKFHRHLIPDGYLFIGHSESLGRNNPHFQFVQPAIYRKVNF